MVMEYRRVVTGHDSEGRSIVSIDAPIDTTMSMRPGQEAAVIWTTEGFPIDMAGEADMAHAPVATSHDDGTVFRVVRYDPGVSPRNHRTLSIDYAVVMSGEIDMELDTTTVRLRAGDTLVQRGTIHNWVNRGTQPCVMAFVLIAAKAPLVQGQPLAPAG